MSAHRGNTVKIIRRGLRWEPKHRDNGHGICPEGGDHEWVEDCGMNPTSFGGVIEFFYCRKCNKSD